MSLSTHIEDQFCRKVLERHGLEQPYGRKGDTELIKIRIIVLTKVASSGKRKCSTAEPPSACEGIEKNGV